MNDVDDMASDTSINRMAEKRITQKDVAERAGVSTSIVSYVINNGPRSVSNETRQRVLRAVEELGYRPNKHAQMLMRQKWDSDQSIGQFGIVINGDARTITRPFYSEIVAGIYAEAHERQMRVRFLQFLDELTDPLLFNELIHPEEISGLLLLAVDPLQITELHSTVVERIRDRIEHVVAVERKWDTLPAVTFDRADAARTAVRHLIGLGHRRIGLIGSLDERFTGYRSALADHQIQFLEELIPASAGFNSPADGHRQIRALLALPEPPTAVFACSDEVAIGALGGLHEMGISVPQEMAVVGIDDISFANFVTPRLTSVRVPKAEMGAYAIRMLNERILRPDTSPITVVLPTELIVRESCGATLRPHRQIVAAPTHSWSHVVP